MASPREQAYQIISDEGKVTFPDEAIRHKLELITEPADNFRAEELVRQTLGIEGRIGPAETRRAVVVALLTPLRQHVGSCFATAPAIRIQREEPLQLLDDLDALISTGRLTRVTGGVEYTVPLSPSWGGEGCPLLKAWEFTLASFAEAKTAFSKWNLYNSLGFTPDEPGGLGEILRKLLQDRLELANREIEDLQHQYEGAYYQATHLEGRLRRAPQEEAKWLAADYKRRVDEMRMLEQGRNWAHERTSRLAGTLPFLVQQYTRYFPDYFQEIYDAEMVVETAHIEDDRPAGFRLLYKHGRANTSAWTLIYSKEEFIRALVDFFLATESQIAREPHMEGLERDLADLVGSIIHHVRSDAFIETAFERIGKLHETAKPWAYVSGGGLKELVTCYYEREALTTRERDVESAEDLFIFLLEVMKELPALETDRFLKDEFAGMLMQSPTHAFQFKPGLVKKGWLDRGNTGSWVRDHIIRPQEGQIMQHRLEPGELKIKGLPKRRLRFPDLRDFLVNKGEDPHQVDAFLYRTFRDRMPDPVIFADTNWSTPYFAFLVNPGTLHLDLWLSDGVNAQPMGKFFADSLGQSWAIYSHPSEYTSH